MNVKFKHWVAVKHTKLDSQRKQKFLNLLKVSPEKILHDIVSLLPQWRLDYIILTGDIGPCCDHQGEPQELLKTLQCYFATQLAQILE